VSSTTVVTDWAERTAELQRVMMPQKDNLCGAFWGALVLTAAGLDGIDQDLVALESGTLLPEGGEPPPLAGVESRLDYRLDLPLAPSPESGTSGRGLAIAIEHLSGGRLAAVPVAGPWTAETVADLLSLDAQMPLIANIDTGALWGASADRGQVQRGVRRASRGSHGSAGVLERFPSDQVARPRFGPQLGKDLSGPAVHCGIVEDFERADALADFAAEENIGGSAEIVAEREILMHDLDAMPAGFDRPVHGQILAFHLHRPMRGTKISGDDLDEGGLAGPVVTHQSHHLARLERQRNVGEGMNRAEMLRNVFQFEEGHAGVHLARSRCRDTRHIFEW
jgi:hypothetical protein